MKKILFTLLLLGLYGTAMAQPESAGEMIRPDFTPPSPQAHAMTKFGDVPVNEFSGMVNATIPIYTARVGKLEIPVSLNYSASGVRVAQTSTWTGINWVLNAGGVISRTINDAPDESISADKRLTADMIIPNQLVNGSSHAAFLNGVFLGARKHYDFKPDLWSYSFGNYSGTFYLDADFVPQFSKLSSNLKIEIVGTETDLRQRFRNSQSFCITTPDGIKYYFGGIDACESSFMGSHRDNPYANTGFYLTKIQHPDHGIVLFEYETDTVNHSVWMNQEESVTIKVSESRLGELCKRPPTNEEQHLIHSTGIVTMNGKWLKRIYSPHTYLQILFNRSQGSSGHYKYVLDNIEVREGSTVMKKADLSYLFPQTKTTSERFFLTKVEFDKDRNYGSGRKNEEYALEYNDPLGLPNRKSEAKDLSGYYNGQNGNSTALPQNDDLWFNNYYPNLADRTPDFNYSVKGTLKKLIYPTKGYTLFEYESLKAKAYDRQHRSLTIWRNNPGKIPASKTNVAMPLGDFYANPDGTMGTSAAVIDEQVKVRVELTANAQMGHTDRVIFKVVDQTANTTQTFTIQMPDGNEETGTGAFNYTREFSINVIKDHIYTIELSNTYSSVVMFEATAYFFNTKGFKTIDENGGLRVKRTTDFSAEDNNAYVKRFYYHQAKDLLVDPYSLLNFKMNFESIKDIYLTKCCNPRFPAGSDPGGPVLLTHTGDIRLRTFSSGTVFTDAFNQKYEYVTISYGGDDFELGGKQKFFNKSHMYTDLPIQDLNDTPFQDEKAMYRGNLESVYHGTLLSEVDIIKRGGKIYKVNEKIFDYDYVPYGNGISGIIGGYGRMNCSYPVDGAENLDIVKFEYLSKKVNLVSTIEKQFTIPMSITLDAAFEAGYKPVVVRTDYTYGSFAGLPLTIRTSSSENNGYTEIQNTYADQASQLSGLTSGYLAAYLKLLQINKIAAPIEIRSFRTENGQSVLTSKKRTLYKNWGSSVDLVLPEIIQLAKGSLPLEDRIIMHNYDNRGNLTLVSNVNGHKIRYEYDLYDNLKAKIENYAGTDTPIEAPNVPVEVEPGASTDCNLSSMYPGALVTWFYYDTFQRLLRRTLDSNCRSTYYEYDALLRLKYIKDNSGNIIEEYDNNYRNN
ncbi:RHS repeat domain-containing protein [Flavobacterium cerinum]|uniref:YD repeat-containing protein n=1 Tax=Flavobacterium cerinum TaxID=2502784 RepID=A0ABY5IPE9_9FLAO|nr:RHS repeat domain-containing protein [Flavobacterium cerinum]UUC44156.1 YD repeat-containing protein [Flavobacterium cerinum]